MGGHGAGAGAEVKLEGFIINFFFLFEKGSIQAEIFLQPLKEHSESKLNEFRIIFRFTLCYILIYLALLFFRALIQEM